MTFVREKEKFLKNQHDPQIWEDCYEFVFNICSKLAKTYPPSIYNNYQKWDDESCRELAQEFIYERLIEQNQLEIAYLSSQTEHHFHNFLRRQLRQHLSKRRKRTVVDNLLDRLKKICVDEPFEVLEVKNELWFQQRNSKAERRFLSPNEIGELAKLVWDIPRLLQNPHAERHTMVYTTDNLTLLIDRVLSKILCIERRDLSKMFERFLTLPDRRDLEDLENTLVEAEKVKPLDKKDREMIRKFVLELEEQDRNILWFKHQNLSDDLLSTRLGISRPTVAKRKKEVFTLIENQLFKFFEPEQYEEVVYETVVQISDLYEGVDNG